MSPLLMRKEKERVEVTCAFCGGRGTDPFGVMSWLSTCYVCGGRKKVWVYKPFKKCRFCKGSGIQPNNSRVNCIVCRGAGVVTIEGPTKECPDCQGSAVDSKTGLYCLHCEGKGEISLK